MSTEHGPQGGDEINLIDIKIENSNLNNNNNSFDKDKDKEKDKDKIFFKDKDKDKDKANSINSLAKFQEFGTQYDNSDNGENNNLFNGEYSSADANYQLLKMEVYKESDELKKFKKSRIVKLLAIGLSQKEPYETISEIESELDFIKK